MSAIDDRVLWTGITAGAAVGGVSGTVLIFGPSLLSWSWPSLLWPGPVDVATLATPELAALLVLGLAMLALPSLVILAFPLPLLALTAQIAQVREEVRGTPRPLLTLAMAGFGLLVGGMPVIIALLYALAIAAVGTFVRRAQVAQVAPAGHPDNIGSSPSPINVVWTGPVQTRVYGRAWEALGATAQHHVVRVAAIHVVLFASAVTTVVALAILTA